MRSYSLLQRSYNMKVVIFSESQTIQELGKEYGIRVLPDVELFFTIVFTVDQTSTTSLFSPPSFSPWRERSVPPFTGM